MSKEQKKTAVPKLRFPEFLETSQWIEESMGQAFDFLPNNSLSRDKLNYEDGTVKNIHYGDIHTKFKTLFKIDEELVPFINKTESLEKYKPESYCREGDLIFADASEDLEDIGKSIELVRLNNEKLLSGTHTILARPKENKFFIGFSGYLFKSNFIRDQIKNESQGAKVLGVSAKKLAKIDLFFPKKKEEQRKIADCLSSLDELISAQSDKIDSLKNYKKGLLQQLFPQDGESVPRLRFPGFEASGHWESNFLRDISTYENGKAHEKDISDEGKYIVANSRFISTEGEVKKFTDTAYCPANINDILMVLSDVPNGRAIAKCFYVENDDTITVNQRICKIVATGIESRFLFYILNRNPYFLKFDDGVKQTNLGKDDVLDCPVLMPSKREEQQAISNILLSLDELIVSNAESLESLKLHKKGLLQQLFPSLAEAEGE